MPPRVTGYELTLVARGIDQPWSIAWLPDGRALVTAKKGALYVLEGDRFREIELEGLPPVMSEGQGGLMDVAPHPKDTGPTPRIYLTMSTGTANANRTILVRGVLDGNRLRDIETLFEVEPVKSGGQHFGSRLLWLPDGTLLMSVGDGGNPPLEIGGALSREQAQRLDSHLGKILRLTEDGKPALGNPFADKPGAKPEIWTYGHRNIQGLARDPATGRVWASEHGPRGGDEINLIEGGKNYGWPLQSFGRDYRTNEPVGQPSVPGMVDPVVAWVPSPAPSGLAVYSGDRYPGWRGSLLSGGLVSKDVRRVELDAQGNAVGQESILVGDRVRDVRQGPDGFVYVLTDEDDGRLLRIEPRR
ncbi:MAG TPA: PQQ-dependent sugar dehydrogenase [Candidatus Binatia bacterium]